MTFFGKIVSISRNQPIGCFFATIIWLILTSITLTGILFVAYAIFAISMIKDTIDSQTGFHPTVENIFVNILTGSCEIDYLTLQNPAAYNVSEIHKDSDVDSNVFMIVKKAKIKLDPIALLSGKFLISSIIVDIDVLNCVRINNISYNLPEFITQMSKITEPRKVDGKTNIEEVAINIKRATYYDVTSTSDIMKWNTALDFKFKKENIENVKNLFEELSGAFSEANAPFIARGLTIEK